MSVTLSVPQFIKPFRLARSVAMSDERPVIAEHVLIHSDGERTFVVASDSLTSVCLDVSEFAEPTAATSMVLWAVRFGQILDAMGEGKLLVTSDDDAIRLQGGRAKYRVPHMDPNIYPFTRTQDADSGYAVCARAFADAIKRTIRSADRSGARPLLACVRLESDGDAVDVVAMDGRRLSRSPVDATKVGSAKPIACSIPIRAASRIRKFGQSGDKVLLTQRSGTLQLSSSAGVVQSRINDGAYPNWRSLMPDTTGWPMFQILERVVVAACGQAGITSSDQYPGVEVTVSGGWYTFRTECPEIGRSEIRCAVSQWGEPIRRILDLRHLLDSVRYATPTSVMSFAADPDEHRPILVTDGVGNQHLIAPIVRPKGSDTEPMYVAAESSR